jgi:hypothetical protein
MSDLKRCCLKNTCSILKNTPTPKCVNYGHIANVSAEEPIRFALLIGSPIAMLDPENIEDDISTMTMNMIGHGKGLRKELLKLASDIKKALPTIVLRRNESYVLKSSEMTSILTTVTT